MNEPLIHVAHPGEPEVTAVRWRTDGAPEPVRGGYVFVNGVCFATDSADALRDLAHALDDAACELDRLHMDGDVDHDGCRHRTVRQIGRKCLRCWQWEADRVTGEG